MRKAQGRECERLLLESIDGAVCTVLGELPRHSLFSCLEDNFGIKREDIPSRMDDFQKAFSTIFGKATSVMTRVIARNLCERLHIPYHEMKECDLKTYVEDCKRRYDQEAAVNLVDWEERTA